MHTTLSVLSDLTAAAPALAAPKTINEVLSGITGWIVGISALVATMFLTIAGLRLMSAGGDSSNVELAKGNFRSALIGYAIAILAPVFLQVLKSIIGG
jgi:hypothetical protein